LIPICPGYEFQMRPCVYRFTARCCASWHTLGTPGDLYAQSEDALADDDSPSKRSQSYELAGDSVMSMPASQTCRPPLVPRPRHHATFHAIRAVVPRFVHKSVHRPRDPITPAANRVYRRHAPESVARMGRELQCPSAGVKQAQSRTCALGAGDSPATSWTVDVLTARLVPRWNSLSNKASCIATP
jgi:hypothetical protein